MNLKTLILILLFTLDLNAQDHKIHYLEGFRDSKWGADIFEVQSKEFNKKYDSLEYKDFTLLVYKGKIIEKNALIYYGFNNRKLLFGTYIFIDDYSNNLTSYFEEYDTLKGMISNQYGLPAEDKWLTSNNKISLYKENSKLAISALAQGLLELKSKWNFTNGNILLTLKQDNGIFVKLNYLSTSFLENYDIFTITPLKYNPK